MIGVILALIAGAALLGICIKVLVLPANVLAIVIVIFVDCGHPSQTILDLITVTVSIQFGYILGSIAREVFWD
jgi:TctA family transporter